MTQHGPRDGDAVLAARYWLTPAGLAAAEQAQAAIEAGELEPLEASCMTTPTVTDRTQADRLPTGHVHLAHVGPWLREVDIERGNDDAAVGLVVVKRRATADPGDQVVLMTLRDLCALLTGTRP